MAPPKPGDLAGIALVTTSNNAELGSPADVTVRPSGGPNGVGLNMAFTNMPNTYLGLSISVDEIDSTFTGLRIPSSCPSPAAEVTGSSDSYDDATARTASAPLNVTNCAALPYAPKFSVSATKDSTDGGVAVVTGVTQAGRRGEQPECRH